jgi:hypothetical protein
MAAMARRVAAGLPVKPQHRKGRRREQVARVGRGVGGLVGASTSALSLGGTASTSGEEGVDAQGEEGEKEKDWVKSAVKAMDTGKAWMNDGLHIAKQMKVRSDALQLGCVRSAHAIF